MTETRAAYRARRKKPPDPARVLLESISEAELQSSLLQQAGVLGWLRHHEFGAAKLGSALIDPGFVDAVLLHSMDRRVTLSRILFVEFKSHRGKVSDDQRSWLDALARVCDEMVPAMGLQTFLWRPGDVDEALRVLAAPGRCDSPTEWRNRRDDVQYHRAVVAAAAGRKDTAPARLRGTGERDVHSPPV